MICWYCYFNSKWLSDPVMMLFFLLHLYLLVLIISYGAIVSLIIIMIITYTLVFSETRSSTINTIGRIYYDYWYDGIYYFDVTTMIPHWYWCIIVLGSWCNVNTGPMLLLLLLILPILILLLQVAVNKRDLILLHTTDLCRLNFWWWLFTTFNLDSIFFRYLLLLWYRLFRFAGWFQQ